VSTFGVPIRHGRKVLATLGVSYFLSAMPKAKAIASYVPPLLDLAKKIEASVADLTRVR
jgi:IclR family mhp operon transcriptional activator